MRHTEYGYVSPAENHCYRGLERWLADKKKRERRAKKHGAFSLDKNKEEAIMNFGDALEQVKSGKGMRLPQWKPDVVVFAQYPDEHSKMTAPYLYVQSRFGRVPWKETNIELFSDDWEIVE